MKVADVVNFYMEKSVNGTPDLSVEKGGKGLFTIEAKFKKKAGRIERDIEPLDPEVVHQAVMYAVSGGFPYYATCNTKRIVLFQLRPGIKPYESEIASLDYEENPDWAETTMKTVLELVPVRLKALDDTLVGALHDTFSDLYPEFVSALRTKLRDSGFKKRYVEWLESQGIKPSDEANRLIAEQTAYLQLNKLLFYQIIMIIYPDRLKPLKIGEEEDVQEAMGRFFKDALKIDYDPIYQRDTISEIPLTARAQDRVRTLLDTLNEFDFSRMESDFIGRIYEKLVPPSERKRLGQFYTPPGIVDLIVNLTITKPDDVVLDPGCGSGSFLVRAYHRLRELNNIPRVVAGPMGETYHRQILEQLYGIDINQFPAHLTVINLAVQNPKARIKKINAIVSDFFDVRPGARTLFGFKSMTTEGEPTVVTMPSAFDVITANPPYIRQELLGEKEKTKIRTVIEGEYPGRISIGAPLKKQKAKIILDRQSDIYIYFYAHGIRFLKEGGRLGFISSNKWLEVSYGVPFQRFLLDNAKILYIIEFDRAVFPDAEVNTAVTIVQKEANERSRHKNLVKFVRLKKEMDMNVQLALIREARESYEDDKLRISVVRQKELVEGKWNIFLRAPRVYQRIVEHPKVKQLIEVANVLRAPTTGCNEYFIISKDKAREWGIERQYLQPCLASPKKANGLIIEDVEDLIFMVAQSKVRLRGTSALRYIEFGERLEVDVVRGSKRGRRRLPEIETLANRKPYWYALPEPDVAPIVFPRLTDVRPAFLWNKANAHTPHVFYYIYPKRSDYTDALLGYLNSSVSALMVELRGRSYGGGVLELLIYEAQGLPALDPDQLTRSEREELRARFLKLASAISSRIDAERSKESVKAASGVDRDMRSWAGVQRDLEEVISTEQEARRKLDEVVYEILGLTHEERNQVEEGLKELQQLRRLRAQV